MKMTDLLVMMLFLVASILAGFLLAASQVLP